MENKTRDIRLKQKYTDYQLQVFKENPRYTDNGFFNFVGYVEYIVGPDWKEKPFSMIIQAVRNMGKSYGIWNFIEEYIWKASGHTERVAYCRTNAIKLKQVKGFFNSKYAGRYLMTDTHIYKIEIDLNTGREIRERRQEVGAVIGVMNEENWRSGEFANYRMVFWDEYNESHTYIGLWDHWVNLLKTIERMQPRLITVLVGNKINANNDILVNLEIELPDLANQTQDIVQTYPEHIPEDDRSIFFVDIAVDTFIHLGQEDQQANIWASFNDKTDAFINSGSFLEEQSNNVLIYRKKILPTKQLKYYVAHKDSVYEFGSFEKGVYFHKIKQSDMLKTYKCIALDTAATLYVNRAARVSSTDDYVDLAELLTYKAKNNQLFYSTFEAKEELETFILNYVNLVI